MLKYRKCVNPCMEKQSGPPEARKPMKECIEEVQLKPRLKALVESLKPLELSPQAIIFTRHGYSSALTESAVKQLEGLARMSKRIDRRDVYELQAAGVGEIDGKITFVRKFVIPLEDRILAIKRNGDLEISGARECKTPLEEYMRIDGEKDRSSISSLLLRVLDKREERDIRLLETFENRFHKIFVRKDITLDKILNTPWEMIANAGVASHTKHYDEKVREAGSEVFGVHIHLNNLRPSPFDIYIDAGPTQKLEWTGIMLVRRESWWETRLSNENFAAFHSNINDAEWLSRVIMNLTDNNFAEPYFMQQDFIGEKRARMMRYGELLDKVG